MNDFQYESTDYRNLPYPPSNPPKQKPVFSGMDTLFAWLSFTIGFFLCLGLPVVENPLGTMLSLWGLFALGELYLRRNGIKPGASSFVLLGMVVLFSLGLITGGNNGLRRLFVFLALCAFSYRSYLASGLGGRACFGKQFLSHLFYAVFALPTQSVVYFAPALFSRKGDNKLGKTLAMVLLGLGLALLPTAIVVALLCYDAQFTALLEKIFSFRADGLLDVIGDLVLGFLLSFLIFGVLYGVKHRRTLAENGEQSFPDTYRGVLPKVLVSVAVTPVLLVYVLFFISQWNYYLSAFTGYLPDELLTYAEYARSGFFELCTVCVINAVLLLLFNLLIKQAPNERRWVQRIYSAVISLFTLVLIVTALAKMVMYINTYGLTQKRVYASWLMLLFGVIFVLVLVGQFWKKLRLASAIVLTCALFFGALILPNVEGMIADYNTRAYLCGELAEIDVESLSDYGVSAVPALCDLQKALEEKPRLNETEAAALEATQRFLAQMEQELEEAPDHLFALHLPTLTAKQRLNARRTNA